jgi:hypothetical protein
LPQATLRLSGRTATWRKDEWVKGPCFELDHARLGQFRFVFGFVHMPSRRPEYSSGGHNNYGRSELAVWFAHVPVVQSSSQPRP